MPYSIAHNAASKPTKAFVKVADKFDVEELLVDIYFHFGYSSKRKNLFVEFCELCDQQYCKIINFHSVQWPGMSTCIERVLRLLPSLKNCFETLDPAMENRVEIKSRITLRKKSPYSELFWSAFFPDFPAFGLNTEKYSVSLRIQSECEKIREKCRPEYLRIRTLFTSCQ